MNTNQSKTSDEKNVKNLLNVLEHMSAPDKTASDIKQAVEYAKMWAKNQIQYINNMSVENENQPPTEMATPRRLFKSRIPRKSPRVPNESHLQRSGSLTHLSSIPNIIRAPRRSASTGRIPARAASTPASSSSNSSSARSLSKSTISTIEQSPFSRYRSKSLHNKQAATVKAKTSNWGTATRFGRSYSLRRGIIILNASNECAPRTTQPKSSIKKSEKKCVSATKTIGTNTTEAVCDCKYKSGKCAVFSLCMKKIFADLRGFKDALSSKFSIPTCFK